VKINDKIADGLFFDVSTIPMAGVGLFTTVDIPVGTPVCEYKGTIFEDKTDVCRQYEYTTKSGYFATPVLMYTLSHPYTKKLVDPHPVFCKEEMGLGGFVNDIKGWENRINCKELKNDERFEAEAKAGYNLRYWSVPNASEFILISTREIKAGEELFVNYGDEYWQPFVEAEARAEAEKKSQKNLKTGGEEKTKERKGNDEPTPA